ncbi:TPA: hypothetical protein NJP70_002279 [Staphylococcus aureus]|nr:hypothetical protein [Staphylococcus aureus]MBR9029604.1 hypothetical protein [Staphylococcus aureus]MBS3285513.1 hypothetical protein [Staphylococcus aureus]MBS3293448.1 hypothetical protein [Staphylococcus aureus]MBS3302744.1 hypothetical protein [Staphylococcus aureus]MBS3337505.1 hypothetical protein [Staphylococcus aureus]
MYHGYIIFELIQLTPFRMTVISLIQLLLPVAFFCAELLHLI